MRKLKLFFACLLMAVLSIGQVWATDYQLVTSTSDLEAGAKYVIGSAASGSAVFMSTETSSNNRKQTDAITITDGKMTATASVLVLELGGSTGAWTFLTQNYTSTDGYLTSAATGKNNHCKVVATAEDCSYFTISFSSNAAVITSTGRNERNILRYNSSNNPPIFACYSSGQNDIYLYKEVASGPSDACAAPTFSPAAGAVVSGTQVAISCSTDGATIHYTTNGTDPTASSATYTSAITVDENMTIKAIAVKAGLDNSSVASAAYTALTPLTTMDQIFAAATSAGSTATPVAITFNNWVVTGVKSSNAYVTDGTKGFIIYTSSHGFQVGDILSGTAICKVQLYNGSAEITELTASKVTVNTGGSVSPVVLDAEGIAALTGANTGSVIKISGACTYESSKYYIAGVQLYNQLYSFSVSAGTNYECTGVYVLNTSYGNEILPRSAADIVAQTSVANPTFTPAAGEYTEVQNVTLSCVTDGATVYYTTDGTNPTNESTVYSSAIEVGASMTIKAIAYKGEDHSEVVSAAYTINLPIPSHDFQVTHKFSTGEGFEFPDGWGGSYAEHEITFTDDKVHFASASHQSGTITDRPVVKEGPISLILTNSHKLISAVRFDYSQWTTKVPTLTMKYSTDGGETYSNFDPVVSSTNFALQVLDMPEGVNAIQVVGTADKQVGLTSIAFDLVNKPVVTKTVTITTPSNGTLVVKNGDDAIASGDAIEVNTVLTIEATPAEGYKLTEVTVNGSAYAESTLTLTENVTIAASFEENVAPDVESYVLSEIGVEIPQSVSGLKVGDKVNLPSIAASCSKVFRGWDEEENCDHAPTYAPGAQYTLKANNLLYAVYATPGENTPTELFATTSLGSTNTVTDGYAVSAVAGAQSGYYQDGGSVGNKRYVQVMVSNTETQIIPAQPSAITVTANIGGGSTNDNLTNPVYAVLLNAAGEEIGDPIALTSAIEVQTGKAYTENLPTANYVDVRGVRIYHVKENKGTSGYNVRYYAISLSYSAESYSDYSTDCQAQVATPTFSPAAGTYTEVQNVTIASETEDVTIYYTTNGDEPTTSSTLYNGAVEVGESMTLKAIAVKSGMANSAVATAEYTINLPLSTMDQIFAAATAAGSTATDANIAFNNWVVSGVSTNGKNVFVTDGTKGFIIFDNGGEMGFAVGDVLSGTVACKVQLYKGAAELTTLSASTEGLSVSTGGTVTPAVKAISALSGINTGAAVTINSVQFDGTNLSDGANSIKPYNTLFAYDALTENTYYNVTGIYQQFDATKEILPRSAADIEEVSLSDPEISYTPASATIELGQSLPGTVFANPHELAISYSSNNEAVATVSNTGVIALGSVTGTAVITASFAGNATYAAANVTYTITVNPAGASQNVVILAQNGTKYYAMTTTIDNETAVPVEVEYDGSKVTVAKAADKDAIQWTRTTSGENTTFQTKDEDKLYLKGTSGGGTLSLNANVCNWSWNSTKNCYVTGTRGFIYRVSTNGFKNYAISNIDGTEYIAPQVIAIAAENIVVTSKVDAELAYTPAEVTLTVGGEFTPATLTYIEGFDGLAAVTYASNNEGVATVDESGVVSLVVDAIGTATITATFAGNNNYLTGSASYTITVNEAGDDLSGTWVLASSVAAGDKIIIMGANNADIYTMGKQNANNRAAVASTLSEDVLNPGAATKVFTLVDAGEGKFAIQASNGNYLTSATSGTSNNLLEAADYDLDNAKWTITIDGEGVASVVAAAGSKTVMQYNSGSTIFSCYGTASQKPVKIFKLGTPDYGSYQRGELTVGNYGTICLPKAGTIEGATLYSIGSFENGMIYVDEVGTTLAAGVPYIFQATDDQLTVTYTSATVVETAGSANGLFGFYNLNDEDAQKNLDQNDGNYILYQNQYWLVSGRAAYIANYRAYIKIGEITNAQPAPGIRRVAMQVNGQNTTTGVDNLNAGETPVKVMINGQMYILRGEKMYNANGQLVK